MRWVAVQLSPRSQGKKPWGHKGTFVKYRESQDKDLTPELLRKNIAATQKIMLSGIKDMKKLLIVVSILGLLSTACGTIEPFTKLKTQPIGTVFDGGPDEEALGKSMGYPLSVPGMVAMAEQEVHLVSTYSGGREQLFPHRLVEKGASPTPLAKAEGPTRFWYTLDGSRYNSDDYLKRQRVTGLLVIKDSRIVLERYQYNRNESNRFLSQSMAKSVTALLVGIAIAEGHIKSVDDLAKQYVPELVDHPYGETSIRHLLQMSSGVKFSEDYTGIDDCAILSRLSAGNLGPGGVSTVMPFRNNERVCEPGKKFQYASSETQVLGLVLRQAIGRSLADYLSEKIWQPMGAESNASWNIDKSGQETAFCCLNATLRDYGRLGMLLANDGVANGKQIVPKEWVREATQPTPGYPHLKPGVDHPYFGYGYQFWVFPGSNRRFALQGVRGQAIFVDPKLKLVMVQSAVWKGLRDSRAHRERDELWRGIVASYGSW
jgi:CubicO group peptidase (beta-lactamase class C family)